MFFTIVNLGALTSKVSAYKYRSWELETKEVLDIYDSLGIIGNVSIKGLAVIRILPNVAGIFDWISDKFRFSFDALSENRAIRIFYKQEEISLFDSLGILNSYIVQVSTISFLLNKSVDIIDGVNLKLFSQLLNNKSTYIIDSFNTLTNALLDERNYVYINFLDLPNFKNLVVWGVDLRLEFPLLEVFFMKKMKFNEIFFIGSFESNGFNLGNNLIKHWFSFFNGQSLMIKNICKSFSLFLSGVGVFGRLSLRGKMIEKLMHMFFIKTSGLFKINTFKYNTLSSYISDLNLSEVGLFQKSIGGSILSNDLLFMIDSTDIYFKEQYKYKVKMSSYIDQSNARYFDLIFPVVLPLERTFISYNLQGGLNFCEKVMHKAYSKYSVSNYLNIFSIFFKYSLILGKTLKNLVVKQKLVNLVFWTILEKKVVTLSKLYVFQQSFFKVSYLGMYFLNINLSLSNVISNYYYTHKSLYYSPTILLADSRLFRKLFTFN